MSIKNKDELLADYLEGLISEEALVGLYPDLKEELEDLKRAQSALEKLTPVEPVWEVDIPASPKKKILAIGPAWLAAASIAVIIGCIAAFLMWKKEPSSTLTINLAQANTEEKLQAIVDILKSEALPAGISDDLLQLAVNDANSNIRYIALQKLLEQHAVIDKKSLTKFIDQENILTNQIAWIELWVNLYENDRKELEDWLNRSDRHPMVKSYGEQILKGL